MPNFVDLAAIATFLGDITQASRRQRHRTRNRPQPRDFDTSYKPQAPITGVGNGRFKAGRVHRAGRYDGPRGDHFGVTGSVRNDDNDARLSPCSHVTRTSRTP
jgi:hypothetical protein